MVSVSVSIDVPNLADGVRFYTAAFDLSIIAEPVAGVAVLRGGGTDVCLLEKRAGGKPSPHTEDLRRYERHWTPVHLDIYVADLKAALARVIDAGAVQEQVFDSAEHGSAAFCSDPFGHGFCLIERK